MEEKNTCPKNCRLCTFQQHAYCAAQLAYNNMMVLQAMSERIDNIEQTQKKLTSESTLVCPLDTETAQSEDGAVE